MDVIPAGMRSEATSRYITDVINTPEEVRLHYAFPNRLGAHVQYAGGAYVRGLCDNERWDICPTLGDDPITMRRYVPEHLRGLTTWQAEMELLSIRDHGRKR